MSPLAIVATVIVALMAVAAFRRARRFRRTFLAMACGPGGYGGWGPGHGPGYDAWEPEPHHHGHRHRSHGPWGGRWGGPRRGRRRSARGVFRFLAAYLALTDAQRKSLKDIVGDWKAGLGDAKDIAKKARREVGDALRSDVFDATQLAEASDALERAIDAGRERFMGALSRLHATLDPSQRERLADLIERGPRAFWSGHHDDDELV